MNVTESLIKTIKGDEALRLKPYFDSVHKLTIGWGRNLQDCGIREDEAELMFQNDLHQTIDELLHYEWFTSQPEGIQEALINMNFNLGITKLLEFKEMIHFLTIKNYDYAANAALNSIWAKEVGNRATEIAACIKSGK